MSPSPPTRIWTTRSGASKCALASITLSADCSASELGAPCVASKYLRASQRRKPLARIGQVSRWPLMSMSAKPVLSGVWNSSADCVSSIRMSACVGPRPPVSRLSAAIASSSAVIRQPAFFNCARSTSNAARSPFFRAARASGTSGTKGALGSVVVFSTSPSSGLRISSAASMAVAIVASGPIGSSVLISHARLCGTRGP